MEDVQPNPGAKVVFEVYLVVAAELAVATTYMLLHSELLAATASGIGGVGAVMVALNKQWGFSILLVGLIGFLGFVARAITG